MTEKSRFKVDRTAILIFVGTIILTGLGNYTATIAASARADKTISDIVQKNMDQDGQIDNLTTEKNKLSEAMARVETVQKFQTDILKDIRDELRDVKKSGN